MKLWITDLDNTLCDTDILQGDTSRIGELSLFPDVAKVFKVLVAQGVPVIVLTKGDFVYQRSKIHQLGLTEVIDQIYVAKDSDEKLMLFEQILKEYECAPEDVVMIGDRLDSEVALGLKAGAKTIWFKYGKYCVDKEAPEGVNEVHSYSDVLELLTDL